MMIKVQQDRQKALCLLEMAKVTLERLRETNMEKYPTNTIKDYYDVIRNLMEALSSIKGVKTKGEGAHKELIDFICKGYSLEESTRVFVQELRDYRNRISYEGFVIKENYIKQQKEKVNRIIENLIRLVEQETKSS